MDISLPTYRNCFKDKSFSISFTIALFLFALGVGVTLIANNYATGASSNPVTDIILSNIRVFNVDEIFVYGPLIFWAILAVCIFKEPTRIPFSLKSLGVFLLIRSFFVSLTHIGPFPNHIILDITSVLGRITSGNDLFFSNHTGMPFLMALVFWNHKPIRYFSLASSVFFGIIVLLAHLHYSIDVFGAFFITYTIFHICEKAFQKDKELFNKGLVK